MVQLLYIIASLHVLICPFTKVEESFNIQATHDILNHRHNLSQYDHNEFPGVVPRSFIGPLVISALSSPIGIIFYVTGINKFWMQYVVRLMLALSVIETWSRLRKALQKQFGNTFAWWFTLITVSQYHFMFYMSRPLPNIMVLPLVLLAFEGWLSGRHKLFIVAAGASIIIFRSELAMLFGLFLIIDLYFKKIDFTTLIKITIPAGLALVGLTIVIDSLFWGRLLWPEAEVFWYNTILNKSSSWGTSPFLWYFYSALPRGLGPSIVLIPVGLYLDRRFVQFAAPAFVYILLYSVLPHKELRFIIYVFPLLNMASAAACSYIYIRRTKAPIYELLFWGTIVLIIGNILITSAFTLVAMSNYPGGVAMTRLHKLLKNESFVHVHICNLAAQTGVTRYTQIHDNWTYSKNESLQPEQLQEYTHLLIEAKSKYSSNLRYFTNTHDILDSIESFSQIAMNYKLMPPVRIKTKPALFILEKRNFREYLHEHESKDQMKSYHITDEDIIKYQMTQEAIIDKDFPIEDQIEIMKFIEETIEKDPDVDEEYRKKIEDDVEIYEDATQSQDDNREFKSKEEEQTVYRENETEIPKLQKAKRAIDDLKTLRHDRKMKAIEKIKLETRKEVVASAKEKLKEIMKRHKHIADELSDNMISHDTLELAETEKDGRGDIPEEEFFPEPQKIDTTGEIENAEKLMTEIPADNEVATIDATKPKENIDSIVEEVIIRLIDRKLYDDKTKPEDIKAEDRLMIQKIVEEVLAERMNYSNVEAK